MNGKNRLQQVQDDVEEVKGIMLDNLNKADERSGKLGELENRADQLLEQSKAFSKTAAKVRQQMWWEHKRTQVLIGIIAVVVIAIIIGIIVFAFGNGKESSNNSATANPTTSP
ncbi:hypothetical protein UPYG_G00181920 [Umbra pygmaea]|uniref:V-SNARE coiled-coil homology domain-containing protein n=1 Tax=Umbra pygmaea TaxID=75934 RepID=A0ABD0WQT1_UMBPY